MRSRVQRERCTVHPADFVGNGQAQTRALAHRAGHAVKPLHDAGALTLGHARAVVFHFQIHPQCPRRHQPLPAAHGDHPTRRGVFDGVVHQVGHQLPQQPAVAGDVHRLHFQPQIQTLASGSIEEVLQQRLAQVFQIHALQRLRVHAALIGPRQGQQLVRQLRSATGGIAQLLDLLNS